MKVMRVSSKNFCIGLVLLNVVALAGCATEAAKKSDSVSRAPGVPAKQSPSSGLSDRPVVSSSPTPSGSSLDALRQGGAATEGPMKSIYFEFDSFALTADARANLKATANWLRANPSSLVEIEGHCDERGTTEYNLALGARRARAAMDYLTTLGVSPARIKTISYGEEIPSCREAAEACYQMNRRDRFVEVRPRPAS